MGLCNGMLNIISLAVCLKKRPAGTLFEPKCTQVLLLVFNFDSQQTCSVPTVFTLTHAHICHPRVKSAKHSNNKHLKPLMSIMS